LNGHGKNSFAEVSKNLTRYRFENNYIKYSSMTMLQKF